MFDEWISKATFSSQDLHGKYATDKWGYQFSKGRDRYTNPTEPVIYLVRIHGQKLFKSP